MQPVTIKNKDYSNTLWLPQTVMMVCSLMLLWIALTVEMWFLIPLPVFIMVLNRNKLTLDKQSALQFSMHSNGILTLNKKGTSAHDDDLSVAVQSIWYLPQILMLKLNVKTNQKPVYLTVFRSVIGPAKFSLLLVGLTQLDHSLNERRISRV